MLLFDDSKRLEKALGEEAAAVLAHVFEKADEKARQGFDKTRQDLATKADLQEVRNDLIERIAATNERIADVRVEVQAMKNDLVKWMMGGYIALGAFLVAVMAFLR